MGKKQQPERFEMRIPPADKRRYEAAARRAGQSLATWLREAAEMREARVSEAKP